MPLLISVLSSKDMAHARLGTHGFSNPFPLFVSWRKVDFPYCISCSAIVQHTVKRFVNKAIFPRISLTGFLSLFPWVNIAGVHLTTRRPCWMTRPGTKAFPDAGSLTPFTNTFYENQMDFVN